MWGIGGGAVSRIDLAIDCKGKSDAADVYGSHLAKSMVTRAQKCNMYVGTDGVTVYVGARTSERYLRVYDKAAQTKTAGNWTRIEMECKGNKAKWIAQALSEKGFDVIGGMIEDYVSCPALDWYTDALRRVSVDIGTPQAKKTTDTRAWLLGVVAKTLAKESKGDDAFLGAFVETVLRLRKVDDSPVD